MGEDREKAPPTDVGVRLQIDLSGAMNVSRATGEKLTFAQRKSEAMLALLAIAPRRTRSRQWLQERLWADRSANQRMESLRQCLADVRRTLGADRVAVIATRREISLDAAAVAIEFGDGRDAPPLLQDFALNNAPAFWREIEAARLRRDLKITPPPAPHGLFNAGSTVVLQRTMWRTERRSHTGVDRLLDAVATTLRDFGVGRVVDNRGGDAPVEDACGVSLSCHAAQSVDGLSCRFLLHRLGAQDLLWTTALTIPSAVDAPVDGAPVEDAKVLNAVNSIVWRVASELFQTMRRRPPDEEVEAERALSLGVAALFRLDRESLLAADDHFARAFALRPRGLHLAWRAYLRTFLIAEMLTPCKQTSLEEALALMSRALELEPANSMVLALSAHVETIVRRSYVSAYELSARSIELNAANPIGWSTLGVAKCHLGDAAAGYAYTQFARRIAGVAPYRFQVDALACLAGVMDNRIPEALTLALARHSLAPRFKPPLRYMAAIHKRDNDERALHEALSKLRSLEPDFSLRKLAETSYPAAALRRGGLV